MSSSRGESSTCTENDQIKVPPRQRPRLQLNDLFKRSVRNVLEVDGNAKSRAEERRKAAAAKVPPDRSLQEADGNNQRTAGSSNSATCAKDNDNDRSKSNVKNYVQSDKASKSIDSPNNFLDRLSTNSETNRQAGNFTRNDERTNYNFLKARFKNNTQEDNFGRTNYIYQDAQKPIAKFNNQTDNATRIVETVQATKDNLSAKFPKDNESMVECQNNSQNSKKEKSSADEGRGDISDNGDNHSDSGWGTISNSGDCHSEDVWETESCTKEDSGRKLSSSGQSKPSFRPVPVEHGSTIPIKGTQHSYKNNRLDHNNDKAYSCHDNRDTFPKGSNNWNRNSNTYAPPNGDNLQVSQLDSCNWNKNRNACVTQNVEFKTAKAQGCATKTNSQQSDVPKLHLDNEKRSFDDHKNFSNVSQKNCDDWDSNINVGQARDQQLNSSNTKNQQPETESSGWPSLDLDDEKTNIPVDVWDEENSTKNQEDPNSNKPRSYQRSNSTHSSSPSNKGPTKTDGRRDKSDWDRQRDVPKLQSGPAKPLLGRSTSCVDRTNTQNANSNAGYAESANSKRNYTRNFKDSRYIEKTESYGKLVCNEANPNASESQETTEVKQQSSWMVNSSHKPKISESSIALTPSGLIPKNSSLKKESFLKAENKVNIDDEWDTTSETSKPSTIELDVDSTKTYKKRIVTGDEDNVKITIFCNEQPKEETNIEDTKNNPVTTFELEELERLSIEPFSDPLQHLFDNCPEIPPPKPVYNTAASSAFRPTAKTTPESNCHGSAFESNIEKSCDSNVLLSVAEAWERHLQGVSSFLKELEDEKTMPLETAKKIQNDVVAALDFNLRSSYKDYNVHIYGSYVSGLAVSTSNINFALQTKESSKNSYLFQLQKGFVKELDGYQVEPFEEDKDPKKSKICFTETETGIPCELGYYTSAVSKYCIMNKMLKNICEFDPRIKTLLIATRIWAEVCLIHEPEEGKLHSVGYSLLMLHFLQRLEKPLLPILDLDQSVPNWGLKPLEIKNESLVGELWLAFLKFYSEEFNWDVDVVTINSEMTVTKSSKFWDRSYIAIEDPFTQKNIGDSVVSEPCAECIFTCFKVSEQYFTTPVDFDDSDSSESGITDSANNSFKKEVFSFNNISFDQNPSAICEKCEELNVTCDKCRPRREVILQPLAALSEASLECVNKTLHDVYQEFRLPDSEVEERISFVKRLENDVKKVYPGVSMSLFGSSVNGFGFKKSDLDICLTSNNPAEKPETNQEKAAMLSRIVRLLRKRPQLYDNVFGLYFAKIPIVKFHVIATDWHCDLSLYNILAVHNSKLLCKYALYDERCRILGCVMKLLAKKACLDDTRCLSSYSYVLSVIHYLQQVEPPVLPVFPIHNKEVFNEKLWIPLEAMDGCNYWLNYKINQLRKRYKLYPENKSTVGELWLGFLDFYARYDGTNAITITQKEPLPSTNLRRCARLLNIQDPFLEKDNLGCILTDTRADETRKVLGRARLLFGKEIPKEYKNYPKSYLFSSSNLTGCFIKEIECAGCGGFGHEKINCLKADPFKRSKFKPKRVPKPARFPQNLKA